MKSRISITEVILMIAIVGLLLAVVVGTGSKRGKFEAVCTEVGGKTVWNGREWQCIKKLT